jgi:CRP-like cAMP-binding protein
MATEKTSLINFIQQTIPLTNEMADKIAQHFQSRKLKKGEIFLEEGKISTEYLFLESGFIRSYLYDTEGNEVTVNFYAPHSVVFEVQSFFQKIPTQENIEALLDSSGWVISFDQLNMLFHTIPEFREFGRAVLVKGFVALKSRTLSMINKTAEQRYETLITSNPAVFQCSPLKHIASYLGITDTSLSRIRKEFSKK